MATLNQVKCTYDDCYRRFPNEEAMKRHKDKEPAHSYCKRCDHDCKDDMEFLIHQIQNDKHICCPVCGLEFRTNGGRDSHVEQQHPMKQDLQCVGCETPFSKASLLMSHIENDECAIITLEHFERQRAEKQIQKDAWANVLNSSNAAIQTSIQNGSEAEINDGGASLLDSGRGLPDDDWRGGQRLGSSTDILQPVSSNTTYRAPRPPVEGFDRLSLDKFPALAPASAAPSSKQTNKTVHPASNGDLLSFDQPEQRITPKPVVQGEWAAPNAVKKKKVWTFDVHGSEASSSEVGAKSAISSATSATYGGKGGPSQRVEQLSQLSAARSALNNSSQAPLPPGARPQDSNTTNSKISTVKSIPTNTYIDANKFYSSVYQKFVCPAPTCSRQFETIERFNAHLVTGAHVGGKTVCPTCLRNFGSTTALITHCESPSKKCNIRKTANYNQIMRELTGGLIGTEGHLVDGSVRYKANEVQEW